MTWDGAAVILFQTIAGVYFIAITGVAGWVSTQLIRTRDRLTDLERRYERFKDLERAMEHVGLLEASKSGTTLGDFGGDNVGPQRE